MKTFSFFTFQEKYFYYIKTVFDVTVLNAMCTIWNMAKIFAGETCRKSFIFDYHWENFDYKNV